MHRCGIGQLSRPGWLGTGRAHHRRRCLQSRAPRVLIAIARGHRQRGRQPPAAASSRDAPDRLTTGLLGSAKTYQPFFDFLPLFPELCSAPAHDSAEIGRCGRRGPLVSDPHVTRTPFFDQRHAAGPAPPRPERPGRLGRLRRPLRAQDPRLVSPLAAPAGRCPGRHPDGPPEAQRLDGDLRLRS